MQEIVTSPGIDPTDLPEKVNMAVEAVDDFIAFLKKNDALKPFVDDLRPKKFARWMRYFGCLSKSLIKFGDPIQEPQRASNVEPLLKLMGDRVLELIEKIKLPYRSIIWEKHQVFYTTERPLTVDGHYCESPESRSRETLHYGEIVVSIPRDHRRGGSLKETFVRICDKPKTFRENDFFEELNVYIDKKARCPDVLIFIHGFKSHPEKTVRRLAKLKKDLEFEGAVILYSWKSGGKKRAYYSDEENVCATIWLLYEFILKIQHKVLDEYKSVSGCELK
jgi:hypothetical protein